MSKIKNLNLRDLRAKLSAIIPLLNLLDIRPKFCLKIALLGFLGAFLELFVICLTLVLVQFIRGGSSHYINKVLAYLGISLVQVVQHKETVFLLGLLCLALGLTLRQVVFYRYRALMDVEIERIKFVLLKKGLQEILLASPNYSLRESVSKYTGTFIAEVFAISIFFSSFMEGILFSFPMFLVYWTLILVTLGVLGGLGVLLPLVLLGPFLKRSSRIAKEGGVQLNAFYRKISAKLLENVAALKIIKMLGKEEDEINSVVEDIQKMLLQLINTKRKQYQPQIWFEPIAVTLLLALTFVGIMMGLSLASAALVLVGLLRMLPFMRNVTNAIMRMREFLPHLISFWNVISAAHHARETLSLPSVDVPQFPEAPVGIRLEGLWFKYNGEWILKDVNLKVDPGNVLAIIGPSGTGKSSLLELICGLLEPIRGEIFFDDIPASQIPPLMRRKHIAFLPQQPVLFESRVLDNLLYGNTATEEEAQSLLVKLGFPPEFLFKEVGEFGKELSGGERQRIAFARAVLQKAPILILDEPTSSLDSITERLVWQIISDLKEKGTTIIIATHRTSLISQVDFLMVLENGRLRSFKENVRAYSKRNL